MKTLVCSGCDGKKKVTCTHCKGTNIIHDTVIATGEEIETNCIWCRGELVEWCKNCNGDGMVEPDEPRLSYERWQNRNALIKIIRPVVAGQNRKNPPTKRLATAIAKALNDDRFHVYWNPDSYGFYEITISKNDRAWTQDDRLRLSWSRGVGGRGSYSELLAQDHPSWIHLDEELDREDYSDYAERYEQERSIRETLGSIDGQIAQLIAQIDALRGAANHAISELPEPDSAKLRTGYTWTQPGIYARTTFPHIWPKSS